MRKDLENHIAILQKSSDFVIEITETLSPPKKRHCVDWFDDMFETSTTTLFENKHSLHKEMKTYEQLKVEIIHNKPLDFWQDNRQNFPIMIKVVFLVFVTQGSSAESERHFSTTGDILCAKRTRRPKWLKN